MNCPLLFVCLLTYCRLEQRAVAEADFNEVKSMPCPLVSEHVYFSIYPLPHMPQIRFSDILWRIQQRIAKLNASISDSNLQLMPDFQSRISVLRNLNYIDSDMAVLIKGRVAREVMCHVFAANHVDKHM